MTQFQGVRARSAQEFSGYIGTARNFRLLSDKLRGTGAAPDSYQRLYIPADIRRVRCHELGIPQDVAASESGKVEAAGKAGFRRPKVINCRIPKGGVGKTTVAGNLAVGLAYFGHRVLLIDADPQASLTNLLGIDPSANIPAHIGTLLRRVALGEPTQVDQAVRAIHDEHMLDIIPCDITLANEAWLMGATGREFLFSRLLEQEAAFFSRYDVVLIDSAPGSSMLTTTMLVGSDHVLAVVTPESQAIAALEVLASNIADVKSALRAVELDVKILVNRFNSARRPHMDTLSFLASQYPGQIIETVVRDFIGFLREVSPEKIETNAPLLEKEPASIGARDIIDVTKSLIQQYDIRIAGHQQILRAA